MIGGGFWVLWQVKCLQKIVGRKPKELTTTYVLFRVVGCVSGVEKHGNDRPFTPTFFSS